MRLSYDHAQPELDGMLSSSFEQKPVAQIVRKELRPHQTNAKNLLKKSMIAGNRCIMMYGPCSFGKTLLAANLFSDAIKKGKKCIFICDRIKLIEQAADEFEEYGLEVGVIQGMNPRTNPRAQIQVASIQTIEKRSKMPEFDFAIIDEAHNLRQSMINLMEAYNKVYFVGLSATPYSKGLGKYYTDLIVPTNPRELLMLDYLNPINYFAGVTPDMKGVPTVQIKTGGRDFNPNKTEIVMNDPKLIGDCVKEWFEKANGMCTYAFNCSRAASQAMVDEFLANGVSAAHIDCYTDDDERDKLYKAHHNGDIKILSCYSLLEVGTNERKVQCLIDRSPTKSLIRYVQRGGRIQRILEGKGASVYLDQAGNVDRFGMFIEDVVPTELHDGEKKYREDECINKPKEEKEARKCPKCPNGIMLGLTCQSCGHEMPSRREMVETVAGELKPIKEVRREKRDFLEGLLALGQERNYKGAQGWAKHRFKDKFGEFPSFPQLKAGTITPEIRTFVKNRETHDRIKRAKTKTAATSAVDNIMAMVDK